MSVLMEAIYVCVWVEINFFLHKNVFKFSLLVLLYSKRCVLLFSVCESDLSVVMETICVCVCVFVCVCGNKLVLQ